MSNVIGKRVEITLDGVVRLSGTVKTIEEVYELNDDSIAEMEVVVEDSEGREFLTQMLVPADLVN